MCLVPVRCDIGGPRLDTHADHLLLYINIMFGREYETHSTLNTQSETRRIVLRRISRNFAKSPKLAVRKTTQNVLAPRTRTGPSDRHVAGRTVTK